MAQRPSPLSSFSSGVPSPPLGGDGDGNEDGGDGEVDEDEEWRRATVAPAAVGDEGESRDESCDGSEGTDRERDGGYVPRRSS